MNHVNNYLHPKSNIYGGFFKWTSDPRMMNPDTSSKKAMTTVKEMEDLLKRYTPIGSKDAFIKEQREEIERLKRELAHQKSQGFMKDGLISSLESEKALNHDKYLNKELYEFNKGFKKRKLKIEIKDRCPDCKNRSDTFAYWGKTDRIICPVCHINFHPSMLK